MHNSRAVVMSREKISGVWLYLPVLLSLLVMVPRLVSPQFGLFDDGNTLKGLNQVTQAAWSFPEDAANGRSRPVYWLYYLVPYILAGENAFAFFIEQAAVYVLCTAGLIYLVRREGGSSPQAVLVGLFFSLSAPIIENFYTLSKGEPIQLLLLIGSLLLISAARGVKGRISRAGLVILSAVAIFLAGLAKETTLIVVPISFGWVVLAWIARKSTGLAVFWKKAWYFAACFTGSIVFLVIRQLTISSMGAQSYGNNFVLSTGRFIDSIERIAGWTIRDFLFIVPLVILLGAWYLARRKVLPALPLLDALVWTLGWLAIYLPWVYFREYYMLPAAAGAAVIAGVGFVNAAGVYRESSRRWRFTAAAVLTLSLVLFAGTLPNFYTSARIQLAVDRSNEDALNVILEAPQAKRVFITFPDKREYYDQILKALQREKRDDLQINIWNPVNSLDLGDQIAAPSVLHQPVMDVRMGIIENDQHSRNQQMEAALGSSIKQTEVIQSSFHLANVNLLSLLCPVMKSTIYCQSKPQLIDTRVFRYAWTLYIVLQPTEGK